MFEKYKESLAKKDANWISLNLKAGEAEITSDEFFFKIFKAGYNLCAENESNKITTINEIINNYQDETLIKINQHQRKEILEWLSKYKKGKIEKKYIFQFINFYLLKIEMVEELDLDKIPEDIRELLLIDWNLSKEFEEVTKKLDKIREEMNIHRIKINKLSPEKQVLYWKANQQHYKQNFGV